MNEVLSAFGLKADAFEIGPFGSGHINRTYRAAHRGGQDDYILQRINTNVFNQPEAIARNHRLTWEYLAREYPDYLFPRPLQTLVGHDLHRAEDGYWRLMPFVAETVTVDEAETPAQAHEAARQFGRFARLTTGVDLDEYQPTIPNFHNLALRYAAFERAVAQGDPARRARAADVVDGLLDLSSLVETYAALVRDLPDRLMHHDTKINNVLLRAGTFEGVCVIDIDTVMPGKVISDLGDMVRTYVSPVSEEERDVARVTVREEYFAALMDGYLSEMRDLLTAAERQALYHAGLIMVYMQAVRFLTDYLNGDVYYPIKYPEHNFDRARNQWTLLAQLIDNERSLRRIIHDCL